MRTDPVIQPWVRRFCAAALMACLVWLGLCGPASAGTIEAVLAPGEVIADHAKVENECASCHVRFNPKGQDALCMDCHKEVAQDVRKRMGFHGKARDPDASCRGCHTDHKGRKARIVQFDPKGFDHKQTDYLLKGKHKDAACDKCHAPAKKYRQAATDCLSCHKKDDTHKGGILDKAGAIAKCSDCHNESGWKDTHFEHGKQTRFALEDKHARLKCDDCHAKARYRDTPRTCIGCHQKDDEHKGQYGTKCESCHNTKTWKDSTFNHDADTRYSLRGKHRKVQCNDCHTGHLYKVKLAQDCFSCHKKDDKHKDTLGRDCESCHSESGWRDPPRFDHDKTSFPLLGKHLKAECKACHKSQLFKEAPKDCFSCHQKDDKHQGTLGKACADCHSERDWKTTSGRFDHSATRFPLRNAHAAAKVKCSDCHTKGLSGFRQTEMTCYACHKKDDKHEGSQGKQCETCHNDASWKVTLFDHGKTRFPLTGRHNGVTCQDCHASKRFKDTPRECVACHLKDDKHKASLGTACETCHNTRHWKSWDFNHDKRTKYPLTGGHTKVACAACHTQPAPKGKAIADIGQRCADCHAKDDAHDGQFGRRCEQCHRTAGWLQTEKTLSQSSDKVFTLNVHLAHVMGWCSHSQRLAPLPAHAAVPPLPAMDATRHPARAGVGARLPARGDAEPGDQRAQRTGADRQREV